MINEGRPVYGLAGYVNEITTFGELDCTVLCTQTHTPNTTRRCTQAHVHRWFPKFAIPCTPRALGRYYILLNRSGIYWYNNNNIEPRVHTSAV